MRLMERLKRVEIEATFSETLKESHRAGDRKISSSYHPKVNEVQGAGNRAELNEKTTMTIKGRYRKL